MGAILLPGVEHRLLPGKSKTLLDPQVINVHTMVWDINNCESYFRRTGNPYSHFGTGPDGEIRQWQDLRYRAASCLNGNPYNISIENADTGPGFPKWSGSDVPAFTDAQADALVVLISWLCHRFGLPKAAIGSSCPHERGIGWHRHGIDPYRNTACGRKWSSAYAKACPGDRRIHQLTTEIIPAVSAPATPQEEDPMAADPRGTARICMREYLGRSPESYSELDWHAAQVTELGLNGYIEWLERQTEAQAWAAKIGAEVRTPDRD